MHPILCRWPDGAVIGTYAVLTALGYLIGTLWLRTQVRNMQGTPGIFWSLAATIVLAGLLGGKLGFFIVEWADFRADPWGIVKDFGTGWVFWPGFLLGSLAGVGYKAWYNRNYRPRLYLPVADYFAPAVALGHALGRLGCWAEGCCHGRPTELPWGAAFTDTRSSVPAEYLGVALHPTQLLEASTEAAAAAFLIWGVLPAIRAGKLRYGTAFLGYIAYYSILRFSIEFLRGDERGFFLSSALSPSQWASLGAGLAAVWALKVRGIRETDPAARTIYADGKP